jgi:hypothetical protein
MKRVVVLLFILAVGVLSLYPQSEVKPVDPANAPKPQAPAKPVIPDKFTNLQVLPKGIEKSELVGIMKGFCMTFKVRCSHCHVATDDLSSADFPSDEKPSKQSARELLRNLAEIQRKYGDNSGTAAK